MGHRHMDKAVRVKLLVQLRDHINQGLLRSHRSEVATIAAGDWRAPRRGVRKRSLRKA